MQGGRRRKSDYKLYWGMWKDVDNFAADYRRNCSEKAVKNVKLL